MIAFILWFCLITAVCTFASHRRNRSAGLLLLLFIPSLVLSFFIAVAGPFMWPAGYFFAYGVPLITWVILAVLPPLPEKLTEAEKKLTRKCPHCFSRMPAAASVCATCTRESPPTITPEQIEHYRNFVAATTGN